MSVASFCAIVINLDGITMRVYEMNKKTGIKQIDELYHEAHYSQEVFNEGKLSFESSDDICKVLQDFMFHIKEYAVENVQLYISNALTDAFNIDFMVTQIRNKIGMKAKVLNNSKEQYLTLQSIAKKMPNFNDLIKSGTLILNIGYGDVQMTLYDNSEMISTQNSRLGVSRLKEMISSYGIRKGEYQRYVHEFIDTNIKEYQRNVLKDTEIKNVIVVGGEMQQFNHYSKKQGNAIYKPEELNLNAFKGDESEIALLAPLFILVNDILAISKADCVYAPDVHLCDGAACDYAYKKYKIFSGHHFTKDRLTAAINLAKHFGCDMNHNLYVLEVARSLFKAVSKPYGLNNKDQQVLELACIMHNCGRYVNLHFSDELTYQMTKECEFINLSNVNRRLVANVLRYKNKEFPPAIDFKETSISSDFYVILARVTALFRLAEALDETHLQKLTDIKVSIQDGQFVIRASSKQDVTIEMYAFNESCSLFIEVFGLKPVLKIKRSV